MTGHIFFLILIFGDLCLGRAHPLILKFHLHMQWHMFKEKKFRDEFPFSKVLTKLEYLVIELVANHYPSAHGFYPCPGLIQCSGF